MIECFPFYTSGLTPERWDEFIDSLDNGTVFHKRKFLSYHPENRFTDCSLVIKKNGRVLSLFPAAIALKDGKKILSSHPGASFGGIVYMTGLNLREAFEIVRSIADHAVKNNISRIEITSPPSIYQTKTSEYIDYALIKNGFQYLKREVSSIVQLDAENENFLSTYRQEARTAVKKARKMNVVIRECTLFEEYYRILKKNLKMRHNVKPTHTLEELIRLKHLFPRSVRLWGAFLKDKLIAGICNFSANKSVVLAFYISHDEKFQEYRAVNLLFYEIMKKYTEEGYKFLDFGLFTVAMEPNWGLARFKENFGASGIFRDSFYKDLRC